MKWNVKAIQQDENIGEKLKQTRVAKGLSVYRISHNYCIPKSFLEAVEANNFETLPNTVFTKGMLKKYLRILQLPTAENIKRWEEGHAHWEALGHEPITEKDIKPEKSPLRKWYITTSLLQKGFAVMVAGVLLVYIGYKVDAAIAPTPLEIIAPHEQMTTTESSVVIVGKTDPEVLVSINRYPITVEADGTFEETVTLQNGLNVLEIEATKKYRPSNTIKRHILVTE